MFGIVGALYKLHIGEDLTPNEKFKLARAKKISPELIAYLAEILGNLSINVLGEEQGSILDLMRKNKLEGWCWESTESAIVFFDDRDYIARGNIFIDGKKPYYHSWICFSYDRDEYVFDPALDILCSKGSYDKIFNPEVIAKVSSKSVRDELLKIVSVPKKKRNSEWGLLSNGNDEYVIDAPEDITTPFYRNVAGYRAKVEKGVVKQLHAHFYYID